MLCIKCKRWVLFSEFFFFCLGEGELIGVKNHFDLAFVTITLLSFDKLTKGCHFVNSGCIRWLYYFIQQAYGMKLSFGFHSSQFDFKSGIRYKYSIVLVCLFVWLIVFSTFLLSIIEPYMCLVVSDSNAWMHLVPNVLVTCILLGFFLF